MEISCPGCQQTLRVADTDAGRKARCPKCETIFSIPEMGENAGESVSEGSASGEPAGMESASPFGDAFGRSSSSSQPASESMDPFGGHGGKPAAEGGAALGQPDELWHLKIEDGRTFGPVPKSELDQWCEENRVTATCFLRRHSDSTWIAAGNVYPQLGSPAEVSSNPFRDDVKTAGPAGYPQTGYRQPHRGGVILTFGILGLFGCGCIVFLGFGIAAWAMGANDLKAMNEGRMDDSGRSLTQTGQILGMIGCGIAIVTTILGIVGNVVDF